MVYPRKVSGVPHSTCRKVSGVPHSTCRKVSGVSHSTCRKVSGVPHSTCRKVSGVSHSFCLSLPTLSLSPSHTLRLFFIETDSVYMIIIATYWNVVRQFHMSDHTHVCYNKQVIINYHISVHIMVT